MPFTPEETREAVTRELKLRRRVYPRRIESGHMTPELAKRQIALFEEIEADYQAKAQGERLL